MNVKAIFTVIFSCFFSAILFSGLQERYVPPVKTIANATVETISFNRNGTTLNDWELFYIQDPNALIGNTPGIKTKHSSFSVDSLDKKKFIGVCWFRKTFKADSTFDNVGTCIKTGLIGAAEIFINHKKVHSLGLISNNKASEFTVNSFRDLFVFNFKKDSIYEILIRFSNHDLQSSYTSNGVNFFGIQLSICEYESSFNEIAMTRLQNSNFSTFFFVFFMTLFLIHFLIFLFNRKEISNLYYSVFCLLVAMLIVGLFAYIFTSLNSILKITGIFVVVTPLFIFAILPYMFRAFFSFKFPRWYKLIPITAFLCIAAYVADIPYHSLIPALVFIVSSVEAFRNIIVALKQKKKGVKIIGTGLLLFILSVITDIFVVIFFYQDATKRTDTVNTIFMLGFFVGILSIPISITIFLAYSISQTNRSLANKLVQVEELSARSIEQEKEKQHILENQKNMLEVQVTERTLEIREQKKLIEEKNKDIIDSINYAKRIQTAMLPDEAAFKAIFTNSFVLYQPRDIVSGDFYYATEINGNKLLIAADCTGHGVPGALMSMVGCNIINKLTYENNIIEPKIVLETLHAQLRQALKQDIKGSTNRDGMDIAAVLICGDEVLYAGANRSLIYFDGDNQLNEIKPTKTPVGGSHIETIALEQHVLKKDGIKQLYLFSDGFADQFGGPEGKKLMVSKFKMWLSEISAMDVNGQRDFLSGNFNSWKQRNDQVDDVMVIGIKL